MTDSVELVKVPPLPKTRFTYVQFMTRLTTEERIAVRSSSDPIIEDFYDLMQRAVYITINNPQTVAGINYLVTAGILTQERADEILSY